LTALEDTKESQGRGMDPVCELPPHAELWTVHDVAVAQQVPSHLRDVQQWRLPLMQSTSLSVLPCRFDVWEGEGRGFIHFGLTGAIDSSHL
jgi:hypothetical protein